MLARIADGAVAELRHITFEEIPPHKRDQWKVVDIEGEGPEQQEVIEDDRVRLVRTWPADKLKTAIDAECRRRLAQGFTYDFGDDRGIHTIGTSAADMEGWRDVTDHANALIAIGDTDTTIEIVSDTDAAMVTAPEWQAIMLDATTRRQELWKKSFALQAMDPIPTDYANDKYWT
jgi:hypothetical protein